MSEAKLSDKLYRWIGENGGWQIGRIVAGATITRLVAWNDNEVLWRAERHLMRCDFGRLHWVDVRDIEEHDTTYREQEREAERAGSTRAD